MLQWPERKTALSSSERSYPRVAILFVTILGLVAATLILRSPEHAHLTPEQISQMPLWGP
jgi:hypothetical protein